MYVITDIWSTSEKKHYSTLTASYRTDCVYTVEDYETGEVCKDISYTTLICAAIFGRRKQPGSSRYDIFFTTSRMQWDFLSLSNGFKCITYPKENSVEVKVTSRVEFFCGDYQFRIREDILPMHLLDLCQFIAKSGITDGVDYLYILYKSKFYELEWSKEVQLYVTKSMLLKSMVNTGDACIENVTGNRYVIE